MKRLFAIIAAAFIALSAVCADTYKITDVHYDISGITRQYALEQAVEIDTDRIFESYTELNEYVENIRQLFNNERNLSVAIVNTSYNPVPNEDGYTEVILNIFTQDSKHFLVVPYPKYNSNSGFLLKLKAKDTNFLGTMETLNCDVNFAIEPDSDDASVYNTIFGVNFSYDYPFKLGKLNSKWNNDLSIDYTIGKNTPEFNYETGFTFSRPFKNFSVQLDLYQEITKDFDYEEYGDDFYFTEGATLSVPFKVASIENFSDVSWAPYVSYKWYWDHDGISIDNSDLRSPFLSVGHSVSTGRVNWFGNFRTGINMSMNQYVGYNFQTKSYSSALSGTIKAYKSFKFIGFYTRLYGFYGLNADTGVGSYLRGIRDDQYYDDIDHKALSTNAAIVGNIDMPFHVLTTDWLAFDRFLFGEDTWLTNHLRWMRYFDFELVFNPFADFAFTDNLATGKTFAIKDGWYAGGIEVQVFPAKWRSMVVRGSCGIDAGRKIVNKVAGKLFDNSWRKQVSALEISIGVGLHY